MDDGYYWAKDKHGNITMVDIQDDIVSWFGDEFTDDVKEVLKDFEIIQKVRDPTIDDYNERDD